MISLIGPNRIQKEILDLHDLRRRYPGETEYFPGKKWQPHFIAWNPFEGNRDFLSYEEAKLYADRVMTPDEVATLTMEEFLEIVGA